MPSQYIGLSILLLRLTVCSLNNVTFIRFVELLVARFTKLMEPVTYHQRAAVLPEVKFVVAVNVSGALMSTMTDTV